MFNQISLTAKEKNKFDVIGSLFEKKLTNGEAAKKLGVTVRQIQRLKALVKKLGTKAVIHRLKGKISNNHFAQTTKNKAMEIIRQKYFDFKPGFAAEKLAEEDDIQVSADTIDFG